MGIDHAGMAENGNAKSHARSYLDWREMPRE